MNLVQFLAALAAQIAALTERIDAMTTMGMTDAEAMAFADLKAQVAGMSEQIGGLQSAIQSLGQAVATNAEAVTGANARIDALAATIDTASGDAAERLEALAADVATLKEGVGDLSGLPALPTP
jgi:uncharacterized protein YceH (UPF0502 family)